MRKTNDPRTVDGTIGQPDLERDFPDATVGILQPIGPRRFGREPKLPLLILKKNVRRTLAPPGKHLLPVVLHSHNRWAGGVTRLKDHKD